MVAAVDAVNSTASNCGNLGLDVDNDRIVQFAAVRLDDDRVLLIGGADQNGVVRINVEDARFVPQGAAAQAPLAHLVEHGLVPLAVDAEVKVTQSTRPRRSASTARSLSPSARTVR